jgi:FkbM family methyltransferase
MLKKIVRRLLTPYLWSYTSAELGLGQLTYSQFGEDILIRGFFRNKSVGVYVDVGAFHPIYYSNTYALYKLGWNGVAIDANRTFERLYKKFRPRDTFVHAAVGQSEGRVQFVHFASGAFDRLQEFAGQVPEQFRTGETTREVNMRRLDHILDSSKVSKIDFLNIDCEGSDLDILSSIDFARLRPLLISVEDHSVNWMVSPLVKTLAENEYAVYGRCGLSTLFFDSIQKLQSMKGESEPKQGPVWGRDVK